MCTNQFRFILFFNVLYVVYVPSLLKMFYLFEHFCVPSPKMVYAYHVALRCVFCPIPTPTHKFTLGIVNMACCEHFRKALAHWPAVDNACVGALVRERLRNCNPMWNKGLGLFHAE